MTELSSKFTAIDLLVDVISTQMPGCYVPRLTKTAIQVLRQQITLQNLMIDNHINPTLQTQFKIFRDYMFRLCDFEHILTNATIKIFLEKKSELREILTYILKQ